jgi:hypothetical protein
MSYFHFKCPSLQLTGIVFSLSSIKSYVNRDMDPGVDGRIIFKLIFKKWDGGGIDWIELAQDKDG